MLRIIIAFCGALVVAACSNNYGDCDQERDWDLRIKACTAIIGKGGGAPQKLAAAFINRGVAYTKKGDYDSAIADFDKAMEFGPKIATVLL
jgi:tetratricopeptide (TPR) repeat protein